MTTLIDVILNDNGKSDLLAQISNLKNGNSL